MSNLEYNGRYPFERPRNLTELEGTPLANKLPEQFEEREEVITNLFKDLAKTFIKGEKLKEALKVMEPAQFIEIEAGADKVSWSAQRFDAAQSKKGTVITYSMYSKAIDKILKHKWDNRITIANIKIPASSQSQSTQVNVTRSSKGNILSEFLDQNGIAGCIISMLTISPFQTVVFQGLTVEEGAKGIQVAQIPIGIALLLELGIKAEKILDLLDKSKLRTPLVETQVSLLNNDPVARSKALQDIGISQDDLKASTEILDAENIIEYVSEHYKRYGGLVKPDSNLTIDHWIAYFQVASNQQIVRGCINTADTYSVTFSDIKNTKNSEVDINAPKQKSTKMIVEVAATSRALNERSNDLYDDIVDAMEYQLTDRDLCCMVELFGNVYQPSMLKMISNILRILAVDLSGELIQIDNMLRKYIAGLLQDVIFELLAQLNEFYHKILRKLTKLFTIDIPNAESCGGLLTIGLALIRSVRVIFEQVKALISEISALIGDYGKGKPGSWTIAADRRHLIGIARVLDVIAGRLDKASACNKYHQSNTTVNYISNTIDQTDLDGSAILSILEKSDPVIQLNEKDKQKYFANRKPRSSTLLKFNYGIKSEQNNSTPNSVGNCSDTAYQNNIQSLIQSFKDALKDIDE